MRSLDRREERQEDAVLHLAQVLQGGGERGQASGVGDVVTVVGE